jgi:phosphatidylserine decarboxylase
LRFAPEGYPFVLTALLLSAAAWIAALRMGGPWTNGLAVILSVLTVFVVWFFRDPVPAIPQDGRLVVAPGQGKVIDIREVDEPSFMRGAARRITIFLSVFDVHVQRAPVSGKIEHRSYKPGEYAVAWLEKASEDNEQASLGITTPHGPVLVRQIAGLIARRIVTDPVEGDTVERGRRIGLIRFGSRVDLFLPLEWEVTCAVGDRARVGATALARVPLAVEA